MISFRMREDLDRYAATHVEDAPDLNEDRMPPVWMCVAILVCYIGIIGVVVWAVGEALR